MTLSRRGFVLGAVGGLVGGCLPDGVFKHRYTTVPERLDDGWEIDDPRNVGLDPAVLEAIHTELLREDRHVAALGMLIVKNGKLVWETYLRTPRDRDLHHHVQSVTKTVTSLAFGIARDDGLFPDLDATLLELMPSVITGKARDKGDITLEHLLTMRSGIQFDNEDFSLEMWVDRPDDPLRYMLEKPRYAASGARFYYRDADPQIIGYLLQQQTGRTQEAYTVDRLFAPLGIEEYLWESGPDGASMAAHGLHLKARDLAKLGQLMLDGGTFAGERVLSRQWCELASTAHVPAGAEGTGRSDLEYGYYIWVADDRGVYSGWGHGGQFLLVDPQQQLVVAKIALPDADLHGSDLSELIELVSPLLTPP